MKSAFTYKQDKWLNDNVNAMGRRWNEIAEAFNSTFGTDRSKESIRRRSGYLLIPSSRNEYTEEQCRWIVEHAYLPRSVMADHFENEFGTRHSVRSLANKCSSLKAYKLIECTGEYRKLCVWTPEIDLWICANVRRFRGRHSDMVKELNHTFGTRFTERAVNYRKWMLKAKDNGFYEHEDLWLLDHSGLKTKELTEMFNQAFGEHRSCDSIYKHMRRLKKKALPDEQEAVKNASHTIGCEITPSNEID